MTGLPLDLPALEPERARRQHRMGDLLLQLGIGRVDKLLRWLHCLVVVGNILQLT